MRIVSLAPSNTEILWALGLKDEIVAVTKYCDFPEEARALPKVGSWVNVDDEVVKKFHPDLILSSTIVQEKIAKRQQARNLPLVHFDPRTIEQVFTSIEKIGELTGKSAEAKDMVLLMRGRFGALEEQKIQYRPRVYVEEWHKPPMVSGNWVPELVEIAGGTSLARPGELSRAVTLEEIKKFNPEIIVLSICGLPHIDPKIIYDREGWQDLDALKNKRVYSFDDSILNRPGPRLVKGAERLAQTIRAFPLK